jgi:hypothetical protein
MPCKLAGAACQRYAPIKGCIDIQMGNNDLNEQAIAFTLASLQPVTVAVYAGNSFWQVLVLHMLSL